MSEKETINPDVKYEPTDANAETLGFIGAGILITAIVLPFLLWGLYGFLEQTAAKGSPIPEAVSKQSFETQKSLPLEPNPVANYEKFRQSENEKLNGYGWVDKQNGVVHIPIEQAMQKLARQGLPDVQQNSNANLSNEKTQTNSANMTQQNTTKK
ncbi:MAG: hypothetical protein ACR2IH_05205 [Pyrinomonadaceae bacterium]